MCCYIVREKKLNTVEINKQLEHKYKVSCKTIDYLLSLSVYYYITVEYQ